MGSNRRGGGEIGCFFHYSPTKRTLYDADTSAPIATLDGKGGFAPDFAAVFHGQDAKRVSYMDVDRAESSVA